MTNKNLEDLEVMDGIIFGYILGANFKVQTEFLYLESWATPLKQVLTVKE